MSKPVIDLDGELGLIVEFPSGVLYTNQVGGVFCQHPFVEGVFVPLDGHCEVEEKLARFFEKHGPLFHEQVAPWDPDALDAILRTPEEPYVVTPTFFLEVDRTRLADSMEAWLHVTIVACPDEFTNAITIQPPIAGFGRASAVLTWMNSD